MAQGLVRYEAACKALAKAKSADEVKLIRNKADAMRAAARIAKNKHPRRKGERSFMPESKTKVIAPLVHLNGTSKQELIEQRANAIDALTEAGRQLAFAGPNGRDYYPEPGLMQEQVR